MTKDIELICRLNKNWRSGNIKIKKAGGQTNRNWLVQHKNKKFFVRLPWERADIVNRKVEAKNIFTLSRNKKLRKILPKYYIYVLKRKNILQPKSKEVFNLPDGTMVAEYIEGKLFTTSLFENVEYQEKLARMFHVFHTSGVHFVNKYNLFRDEIEKYRLIAKKYPIQEIVAPKIIAKFESVEKEAKSVIPLLKRRVPAHNDFIFQNFIAGRNNRIYLLDFEYAGSSEKGGILYDFGFLFADNLFRNPPVTQELFEKFLEVAAKIYKKHLDKKQIYWLAIAVIIMQFWWGLLRYFSVKTKKEKKYFKDYISRRTKGIWQLYHILSAENETGVRTT